VRPTGIFPIFKPFMTMARRGVALIPGDGRVLTNPVHPLDVAECCVEALTFSNGESVAIGGPDIFSREEIARMAFEAIGREPRILHVPRAVLLPFAGVVRLSNPRLGEVFEFVTCAFTSEFVAPIRGRRRLPQYFAELASDDPLSRGS